MLLMSYIPSYDLSGLNMKVPDETLNRQILDKHSGPIYDELEQT